VESALHPPDVSTLKSFITKSTTGFSLSRLHDANATTMIANPIVRDDLMMFI
jgi:hypothetical protein